MKKRGQNGLFLILIFGLLSVLLLTLSSSTRKMVSSTFSDNLNQTNNNASEVKPTRTVAQAQTPAPTVRPLLSREQILEALAKKYKAEFKIDEHEYGNEKKPFRLSTRLKLQKNPGQSDEQALYDFINEIAPVLNIDQPEQIKNPANQEASLGNVTNYEQIYDGIPVDGAQVRVHQDKNGNVFMVNSTYIDGVRQVNTSPSVPSSEAVQIALRNAISLDPNYSTNPRQPTLSSPVLVIHKFTQSGAVDLCWKVVTTQPWLGHVHAVGNYFINAHTSSIFERIEGAVN